MTQKDAKKQSVTDGPTDGRTDRPTDGAGCRVAGTRLKIKGLQKLWTNKKRLSPLLMKKCDINCILDTQSLESFIKITYLTSKPSQLLNFIRVWSINHIIARVSRFFWQR